MVLRNFDGSQTWDDKPASLYKVKLQTFCHCCKHFKKSNMDNSQYEIIYNYVTRGEYPAQSSKEQKRSIRRMVQSRNADDGLHKKFITKDGVLYFVDKKSDGLGLRERRVVRLEESTSIIRACHEAEIGGGHFKRDKTFVKISERFYWNGMMKDVKEYVSSCWLWLICDCVCIRTSKLEHLSESSVFWSV